MKKIYTMIFALLLTGAAYAESMASTDCTGWKEGYPEYYCDCEAQRKKNKMTFSVDKPFDVTIKDTTWYAVPTSVFMEGFTAYLYSECDAKLVAMQTCYNSPTNGMYKEYIATSNQSIDISGNDIQQKLDSLGITISGGMRFGILPKETGKEMRFICTPYNTGKTSTCDDCLALLPGMVLVTSTSGDVFEVDPQNIPEKSIVTVDWFQTEYYCDIEVTVGECDADPIEVAELDAEDTYTIPTNILSKARLNNEKLYLHFYQNGVGRIRLNVKADPTTGPATDVDNVLSNAHAAKLVLGTDGVLYIQRGTDFYTITGQKR